MLRNLTPVLLLLVCGVVGCQAQVNATLNCLTCTSYTVSLGTVNITLSCPAGTVCGIPAASNSSATNTTAASNTTTSICSAANTCNNVVCDHYAVFPSPTNCQQYYVCRYRPSLAAYALSTVTCPGASRFNVNTGKCTLSSSVVCSTTTSSAG
uniref:Chitin-binding type-2 domain-containing protein n=1 Tax=Cuerna arida TaxID=1464854 RepID=A0A1B6GNU1_9HEMI